MAETIYVPSYMLGYQCQICGVCCGRWRIFVEKQVYKDIKNIFVTRKIPFGNFEDFFQRVANPQFGESLTTA